MAVLKMHFRMPEEWLGAAWGACLTASGVCPVGVMDKRGMLVKALSMCLWHAGVPL